MKLNKVYFLCIILLFNSYKQIKAIDQQTIIGILGGVAGFSTIWAIYEKITKNNTKIELSKAQEQIEKFKNGIIQNNNDQKFLSSVAVHIKNSEFEYGQLASCLDLKSKLLIFKSLIQKNNLSVFDFVNTVKTSYDKTLKFKNTLELKINDWQQEDKHKFLSAADDCLPKLNMLINALREIYRVVDQQKNYLELLILLDRNFGQTYATEIAISKKFAPEDIDYSRALDKHISMQYSEAGHQFPYLMYAEKIKRDINSIKNILEQLNITALEDFQMQVKSDAKYILSILTRILENIVITDRYIDEKNKKPEFDKQARILEATLHEKQERLNAELRERQARIEKEKRITETKLQEERNRAQHLANQQAEIERAHYQLVVQEKAANLEWARIRDGATIKDAVAINNNNWQNKIDSLNSDYNLSLKNQHEYQLRIDNMTHEISELKSKIKYIKNLEQEVNALKDNISWKNNITKDLETSLKNPPVNPDSVSGLRDYINKLKNLVNDMNSSAQVEGA